MTSDKIIALLAAKHQPPGWAFFPEFRNGTGFSSNRTIDAYAVSFWKKGGGEGYSVAYEVKISRQDFMNEIKAPDKRRSFVDQSNQFYFVCPKDLVKESEIPEECGLMYATEKQIKIAKIAPQRSDIKYEPQFYASLISRFVENGKQSPVDWNIFKFAGKDMTFADFEKEFKKEEAKHKEQTLVILKKGIEKEELQKFRERKDTEFKEFVEKMCTAAGLDIEEYMQRYNNSDVFSSRRIFNPHPITGAIHNIKNEKTSESMDIKKVRDLVEQLQDSVGRK